MFVIIHPITQGLAKLNYKKVGQITSLNVVELGPFFSSICFMLVMSPSCVAYNKASKSALLMLDIDTATQMFLCPPTLQCCA